MGGVGGRERLRGRGAGDAANPIPCRTVPYRTECRSHCPLDLPDSPGPSHDEPTSPVASSAVDAGVSRPAWSRLRVVRCGEAV